MKIFFILLILLSFKSYALEIQDYNFSLIFGTANLTNNDGEQTHGSGLALRSELFLEQNWGVLISGGTYHTESDTIVNGGSEYTYDTFHAQTGGFLYFADYFRIAAGLGIANISETKRTITEKLSNDFSEIGPFYQVGFKYPVRPMIIGVDFIYQSYKEFTQKGFYFMLGFII